MGALKDIDISEFKVSHSSVLFAFSHKSLRKKYKNWLYTRLVFTRREQGV